jgi:hypothetical protein
MTKVRRKNGIGKDREFKVVHVNAAGVDVSPKEMQVCVPSDRAEKCNRTFGVYTKDLQEISAWLKSVRHRDGGNGIDRQYTGFPCSAVSRVTGSM